MEFKLCQDQEFVNKELNSLEVFDLESINKYVFDNILKLINK
jgi:hypothetical protein